MDPNKVIHSSGTEARPTDRRDPPGRRGGHPCPLGFYPLLPLSEQAFNTVGLIGRLDLDDILGSPPAPSPNVPSRLIRTVRSDNVIFV
jgi:hypothetical protein